MGSDAERWSREIELQKIYAMTPTEASYYTSHEAGYSVEDIAEMNAVQMQVVRNTLSSARSKLRGGRGLEILIIRPVKEDAGASRKMNALEVLCELCRRTTDMRIQRLRHVIRIYQIDKSVPGDISWMNDNVFRYYDLVGTRSQDEVIARVDGMMSAYERASPQGCMMGYAVLRYWLDKWYMNYDIVEE